VDDAVVAQILNATQELVHEELEVALREHLEGEGGNGGGDGGDGEDGISAVLLLQKQ
jgi:hypothetical protein